MIYFIQGEATKLIKIGYTDGPENIRVSQIQADCSERVEVLGTAPGSKREEKILHARFITLKFHGEWFRPSLELLTLAMKSRLRPYRYGALLRRL